MDANTNMSEVAQLRIRLAAECAAFRAGLEGYAAVARHEIINRRYDSAGEIADRLANHIGVQEAYREFGALL